MKNRLILVVVFLVGVAVGSIGLLPFIHLRLLGMSAHLFIKPIQEEDSRGLLLFSRNTDNRQGVCVLADSKSITEVSVMDNAETYTRVFDKNGDGIWDFRSYSLTNVSFTYGHPNGYPDTIIDDNTCGVVRIEGTYFDVIKVGTNNFIQRNGTMSAIRPCNWGYVEVEDGEPRRP